MIQKFSTMEEVIARANKNNYGLAAAVFTKDVSNALFMSNRSLMVMVMMMVVVKSTVSLFILKQFEGGNCLGELLRCSGGTGDNNMR